jgi:PIN domain nuclease of toxin-antitoxin system
MNLLLDTHIVIWFITDDIRLSKYIRGEIRNMHNNCKISIVSFWEIAIKHSKGRLNLNSNIETIFNLIHESKLETLQVSESHILSSSKLDFHHHDPFDRLLIGQAIAEDLILVSVDNAFRQYPVTLMTA